MSAGLTRRQVIAGGAATLATGVAAGAGVAGVTGSGPTAEDDTAATDAAGQAVVPFHGVHQAGIDTPAQAFGTFVAFDLRSGVGRAELGRWMRLWTDDAERLTQGLAALADTEPELASVPSSLTVTVGVGAGFVTAAGFTPPGWLRPLPAFSVDRLEHRWSAGDVLVQVCADDPVTVSHAVRMLSKDARAFATLRWVQRGFLNAPGTVPRGATPRNLMGQLDGTANPAPGSEDFARIVWIDDGPDWLRDGTSLVLRRIRIELETWDLVDRRGKEQALGRRLSDGAPLGGASEHDAPDFAAVDDLGFTVIPPWAHIRRARPDDPRQRIARRPYNYDDSPGIDSISDVGLLFASYQADVDAQFVPIQRRLDEADLLNTWTTPIGSAVFAILPGVRPDRWIGAALLT